MWNLDGAGRINWSDAAKMLLVGLIKKYPNAIRDLRGGRRDYDMEKRDAWDLILNDLLDYGMPSTTLDRVKQIWSKIKSSALEAQRKWKRNKKGTELTKLQLSVIDLLNFMNKESAHLMPKPITIKAEPIDEDDVQNEAELTENVTVDTNNSVRPVEKASLEDSLIKGNLNPVVVLNRIPAKRQFTPPILNDRMANEESAKYWKRMTKHEDERMAFERERFTMEREIHRKNVDLIDLKMRIEKEKLETAERTKRVEKF